MGLKMELLEYCVAENKLSEKLIELGTPYVRFHACHDGKCEFDHDVTFVVATDSAGIIPSKAHSVAYCKWCKAYWKEY
jgi:hypothetical protein